MNIYCSMDQFMLTLCFNLNLNKLINSDHRASTVSKVKKNRRNCTKKCTVTDLSIAQVRNGNKRLFNDTKTLGRIHCHFHKITSCCHNTFFKSSAIIRAIAKPDGCQLATPLFVGLKLLLEA